VNGQPLARLIIQHAVGVRARSTCIIRRLDEDDLSGLGPNQAD